MSCTPRMTSGWVNHELIFILRWTIPSKKSIIERTTLNDSCHKPYFIFKTYVMSWLRRCLMHTPSSKVLPKKICFLRETFQDFSPHNGYFKGNQHVEVQCSVVSKGFEELQRVVQEPYFDYQKPGHSA